MGAGDHQQGAAEVLERIAKGYPGVARYEGWDGQRRGGENGPDLPPWEIRPFNKPCSRRADDCGSQGGGDNQTDRVDQQPADKRAQKQIDRVLSAHARRLNDCEGYRQQNKHGCEQRGGD
jgi:hypothetical protein